MLPQGRHVRVRQLNKDKELLEALVALLPFAGLWTDSDLGPLNRELAMRCREVCFLRTVLFDLS